MTLTGPQITTLAKFLAAARDDWDFPGAHSFVAQLATDPRPWPVLAVQAVTQAGNVKNQTPKCILDPLPTEAVVRPLNPPAPPRHDDPECAVHGGTARNAESRFVCCVQEAARPTPVRPVPAPFHSSTPPPADFRDRVEAAKGRLP